jgi:hypothetical protein
MFHMLSNFRDENLGFVKGMFMRAKAFGRTLRGVPKRTPGPVPHINPDGVYVRPADLSSTSVSGLSALDSSD